MMPLKLLMLSAALAAFASILSCQVRQEGGGARANGEVSFLIGTISPAGEKKWSRSDSWNAAEDMSEVYVAASSLSSVKRIDSLWLFARAGQVIDLDSAGTIADMNRTDSAATWVKVSGTLLEVQTKKLDSGEYVIASFSPDSVQARLTAHRSPSPVMTRIAVEIWSQGVVKRLELRTAIPE